MSEEASEHSDGTTRRWVPVGVLHQADETALHVDAAGHAICLTRSQGVVRAMLDECSHGQVALSEGDVENGFVECWMHGSRFDLSTGVPSGPPAVAAVPVYPVRITSAGIEVGVPDRPADA